MTIPSERTRPRPDTYEAATQAAVESRTRSIALTSNTAKITIELYATFWACDGYYDNTRIEGVDTPIYEKAANLIGKRTSNVRVVLGATYLSHAEMIRYLVQSCDKKLAVKDWQIVKTVVTQAATFGPVEFSDATYETTCLADLFQAANITLPVKRDLVHLTFWYFNVKPRPEVESPTPFKSIRGRKRTIDRFAETPTPIKRKTSRSVKLESVPPIKKEVKQEIKQEMPPTKGKGKVNKASDNEDNLQVEEETQPFSDDLGDISPIDEVRDNDITEEDDEPLEIVALAAPRKELPSRSNRGKNKYRDE